MTDRTDDQADWSVTTWKGSRLHQHRAFHALPFARKLELIEEMSETSAFFAPHQERSTEAAVNEDRENRQDAEGP